jgi:glycosyltransferase involved in cell wall biosynthesis
VANSRATAEAARRITGREDIQVIPMGVDVEFFDRALLQKKQPAPGVENDKIVLYAGRLIDVKGVEYLVKALPLVLERQANAKLLVVGSGPCKGDLVSLAERLHVQDKVMFRDAVSQEELVRYYSMSDVFVLPSVITEGGETEGLGLVLLEAMACGVPVIGSAIGGIPDIIKDGDTGLLAQQKDPGDLAEKICRVLAEKDFGYGLGKRGRDFVKERFSWPSIGKRYLEAFSAVLEKRGMPVVAENGAGH